MYTAGVQACIIRSYAHVHLDFKLKVGKKKCVSGTKTIPGWFDKLLKLLVMNIFDTNEFNNV